MSKLSVALCMVAMAGCLSPLVAKSQTRHGESEETFQKAAPEFDINTLQGQRISLKQLAGHVVVLDFWATWCAPCRASVPELRALTKKYPADRLTLISVSVDKDDRAWREFVGKKKMDWAQYRDEDHKVRDEFGVRSYPTYMLIDGDGIIRERFTGFNPQESMVHRLKASLQRMPQLEGEASKQPPQQ